MKKIKIGILGTGNIGFDLLVKIQRSTILECGIFAGHNIGSENIKRAKEMGIPITFESVKYIQENPDCCEIVFDATSAKVHQYHAPILKALKKYTLDLTPAHMGPFCIPVINLEEALRTNNVNLVTCGGQSAVPIAYALQSVINVKYLEIVSTIASKSAGSGTRNNIDEFTQATKDAVIDLAGIKNAKTIITLNPANPPITMHNTIYALVDDQRVDIDKITVAVKKMEQKIQSYVPGYNIVLGPVYENGRITTIIEVVGSGDYLPKYAGNLDIITCAAIKIAETYAQERLLNE